MNIVGPSWVCLAGEKWYVLVILDDFSRYSWVFFLVSKDDVFSCFWRLALRLFKELSGALKAICSDNGIDFKIYLFDTFCLEHGIEHQFFAPCVPQQNSVVERKTRTLVEMARTMLDECRTPRKFSF